MQDAVSPRSAFPTEAGHERGQDRLRLSLLLALLIGLGAAGHSMFRLTHPPVSGDAALNGAGWEVRRLAAQFLWLKSDAVHHAGIEERVGEPEKKASADRFLPLRADRGEDGLDHGHDPASLVIPSAKEDFRGVIGDLERAVKPYVDAQGRMYHKDLDQTIPYYRLLTWADPHFVQGYLVGASFICRAGKHVDRALEFLHEGERNNPGSFEIQTELGHFYLVYRRDYPAAEKHLLRALALVPGGRELPEQELDTLADTYRWLALTYEKWAKIPEAVRTARMGLRVLGKDVTLDRIIRLQPH
jgi:tetratricopeptide (TPR) repeat protein